jgi:hypothetical protein
LIQNPRLRKEENKNEEGTVYTRKRNAGGRFVICGMFFTYTYTNPCRAPAPSEGHPTDFTGTT